MLSKNHNKRYPYCVMLNEEAHSDLWEMRQRINYLKPTAKTVEKLNSLVGEGNWIFQSKFANDVDGDRMALWFCTETDQIAVKLWLDG